MNNYKWSAKYNAFFPVAMLSEYEASWEDLSDLIDVEDSVEIEFNREPPKGKVRIAGNDGMPAWGVIPPLSQEQLIEAAEISKLQLIEQANSFMNSKQWPGKAAIGRLTGDELAQYNLWLDYLDALESIDSSSTPDINWPAPPEV
ncbi:TPA: tail fiber assembly protein [Escherichia coli]|nr:tail fiber assembly protein [Escherichia coli]HDP9799915.1 tail fiber assembly protein [Escherichia coli]